MKRVLVSQDTAELGLLQNMLTEAHIPCEARNLNTYGTIPWAGIYPELWVLSDGDYTKARAMIEEFEHPSLSGAGIWQCSKCAEQLGSQFESCWQCGTKRTVNA